MSQNHQNGEVRTHHKNKSFTSSLIVPLVTTLSLGLLPQYAQAIPMYTLEQIGLTDAEHTSSNGFQYNRGHSINTTGQAVGTARRYDGNTAIGYSAWLYDGTNTHNIGLNDIEHTRSDGYRRNYSQYLNDAGQVLGTAARYNGSDYAGNSVWLYNGNNTLKIGLTDNTHTSDNGYQYSNISTSLNNLGQVAGVSSRYYGNDSAWLHDDDDAGQSAWLYDGSITRNIGLTNAEHTSGDGYQYNTVTNLQNNSGQIVGNAVRYNALGRSGNSLWLYNGSDTQIINPNAYEGRGLDTAIALNDSGQVIGTSHYGYIHDYGLDVVYVQDTRAWLFDGTNSIAIGLTDSTHAAFAPGADGSRQESSPIVLNEAGHVVGQSRRYDNYGYENGQSAWLYDGSSNQNISLTGGAHTRSDGYQVSYVQAINEAGQVIGSAERYDGSFVGQTAWFYDTITDTTYSYDLAVNSSDNFAFSGFNYLGEDGLALGSFTLFDDNHTSSVFGFTVEDGFFDLETSIVGDIADYNWESLANALYANGDGQFIGSANLLGGNGRAAFIATPAAVPVPAAIWLMGSALIGLLGVRKKATS